MKTNEQTEGIQTNQLNGFYYREILPIYRVSTKSGYMGDYVNGNADKVKILL